MMKSCRVMTLRNAKTFSLAATVAIAMAAVLLVTPGLSIAQTIPGGEEAEGDVGPVGVVNEEEFVDVVIQRYVNAIQEEDDPAQAQTYENDLYRLEVAKAIYQHTHDQEITDERFTDKTEWELLDMLDATYGPESSEDEPVPNAGHGVSAVSGIVTHTHGGGVGVDVNKIHTARQSETNCDTGVRQTGTAKSTLTSYTNGDATIKVQFNYPADFDDEFRVLRNTVCYGFDHDETVKRHDVLISNVPGSGQGQYQSCTVKTDKAVDTKNRGCNAFGPDKITILITYNTYDSNETHRTAQLGTMQTYWLRT